MKRFLFVLMTFFFLFGAVQAYRSDGKKPHQESTYHALIIGNNQYKYLPKLKTAHNDAIEVEKLLKEKFKFQTEILLDATRTTILGKINEIRKRLGEKDSLLIYYAGHGEYDKDVGKAYWLPSDAQRDDPTNWIMADDITSNIKRMAARHILIVSDSCYSGTLTRQAVTELITTGGRESYLKKMQGRPSRTLMASGGNEPVSDSGGGNNSVFAAAFLKSLKETDKETFTAEEIFHSRIKEVVAGKSDQVPEYGNIKNSGHEGGDFIFKLAKIEVEPLTTEADIKVKTTEEEERIRREQQKLLEEQAKIADDKKRLEEQIKLEKEHAKVAEEKALWEAKKKEAEEQSKRQQEAQQKLAEERTRLEMERKRLEEDKKLGEEKKHKLEKEKQRLSEEEKALVDKEVKKPVLSQPWLELSFLLPEYQISPPDPKDPPEVQKLLGMWIGKWNQPHDYNILVVTGIDISEKRAYVFYVWSNSYSAYDGIKAYSAHIAEFVPGEEPVIKWGDGSNSPQYEFVLKKDELVESRWLRSSTKWGTLTKVPMD